MADPLRLGIFASGHGSNLQAVFDAMDREGLPVRVEVVISNNSRAHALQRARARGIPAMHVSSVTQPDPADRSRRILHLLEKHRVEAVVLAGYMKRIPANVLERYRDRILNVHPALLPLFGGPGMYGLRVHQAVWSAGVRISGATVHLVEEEYDSGSILAQVSVPLSGRETPQEIAAKVLPLEHRLLPRVLRSLAEGRLQCQDGRWLIEPSDDSES